MFNNYTQNTGLLKSEYVKFQDLKLHEIKLATFIAIFKSDEALQTELTEMQ